MEIILLMLVVVLINVLFWGGLIYLVIRFWKSNSGLSSEEKLSIIGWLASIFAATRSGPREPGPAESQYEAWKNYK
jgi:hypothetical protein